MTHDFTAEHYFAKACTEFGLEKMHTIAIGKILEAKKDGYLEAEYADDIARILYNDGAERLFDAADDEYFEEFDGFVDYSDESGFDPYMGCYTGDC